jgi:hypothetical protein
LRLLRFLPAEVLCAEVLQARLQAGLLRTEVLRSVQLLLQRLLRPVRRSARFAMPQAELLLQQVRQRLRLWSRQRLRLWPQERLWLRSGEVVLRPVQQVLPSRPVGRDLQQQVRLLQ